MYSLRFAFCLSVCLFVSVFAASDEVEEESERHVQRCSADERQPWSYRGENGPQFWGEDYESCHGRRQSPIAIDSGRVEFNRGLSRMFFYYHNPLVNAIVRNDGHTLSLIPNDTAWRGVYVNNTYFRLTQVHFHWGSNSAVGSEHVLDGVRYPMEMHLVHRSNANGTTVVAVLFDEVEEINAQFQYIVNEIPKVMYRDTQIVMHYDFYLLNMLPEKSSTFYRYEGSLTTPECNEGVTWSIVRAINHIGADQLRAFRRLFSSPQNMTENSCRLSDNFRPLQSLNRRKVFLSC